MSETTDKAGVLLNQNVAPEQFDWDSFESGLDAEARKEKSDLEEIYNGSLNNLQDNDVLIGRVVRLTDKEAIVDINFKSEGVISLNEFRYNQGLAVGDEVEVMVDRREDKSGQLQLSHKKARTLKAW
ncbi:MAG TPA: S1 RNA-binding domain-containing protein, partial [Kaistella chaponensis]|nr:S1 RNA-binding domain-containing protein [Kaistella chaponensis]